MKAGNGLRAQVPVRVLAALSLWALLAPPAAAEEPARAPAFDPASWPALVPARQADPRTEARVAELLARMTLAEKVGQVIQADISSVTPDDVREYHLGSVLAGGNSAPGGDVRAPAAHWLELADRFFEASTDTRGGRTGIPTIWGIDAVHGHSNIVGATIFPHNIGLGAARDPELIRRIARVTATEMAVTGIEWTFAPTLAVVRNDRWGRSYEGYAEHPEVVRAYARPMVEGLQGTLDDPARLVGDRVIATAKHFVGDGGTVDGIDQGDNISSPAELLSVHAAGYLPAIQAGVETVMASYNSWHGRKMHGYEPLLTGVLKERWGFDGFVVGDWNGHGQLPGCSNDDCPQALNAGLDMYMAPDGWRALHANTLAAVRRGDISQTRLDDAVRRILRVKLRARMLDRPKPSERPVAGDFELLGAPAHRALAREAVRKSLVLLKNDGGVLPLAGSARVLVAGPAATDVGMQTGGWTLSWQGTGNTRAHFPNATTIAEGIVEAVHAAGGRVEVSPDGTFDRSPDAAVVVFGEPPYAEGDGDLPDVAFRAAAFDHLRVLRRLREQGVPVVSVFLSGRPLWVNPELDASDAFVAAWLPGSEGAGIADVIVGGADGEARHDFSGKLSFSWPASPQQARLNVGDEGYAPLFEYGYGLSYADPGRPAPPSGDADRRSR